MDGLHGGDHTDAIEPLHVLGVDALRVLDARPPAAPRLPVRSERVERTAHGAVADRVQAHVELGASAPPDQVDEVRLDQTSRAGPIEHLRGAASQRSIQERLYAPDANP